MNAGGIIDICYQHYGSNYSDMRHHVDRTADTLEEIFKRSRRENRPTHEVADELAEERFQGFADPREQPELAMG